MITEGATGTVNVWRAENGPEYPNYSGQMRSSAIVSIQAEEREEHEQEPANHPGHRKGQPEKEGERTGKYRINGPDEGRRDQHKHDDEANTPSTMGRGGAL